MQGDVDGLSLEVRQKDAILDAAYTEKERVLQRLEQEEGEWLPLLCGHANQYQVYAGAPQVPCPVSGDNRIAQF